MIGCCSYGECKQVYLLVFLFRLWYSKCLNGVIWVRKACAQLTSSIQNISIDVGSSVSIYSNCCIQNPIVLSNRDVKVMSDLDHVIIRDQHRNERLDGCDSVDLIVPVRKNLLSIDIRCRFGHLTMNDIGFSWLKAKAYNGITLMDTYFTSCDLCSETGDIAVSLHDDIRNYRTQLVGFYGACKNSLGRQNCGFQSNLNELKAVASNGRVKVLFHGKPYKELF